MTAKMVEHGRSGGVFSDFEAGRVDLATFDHRGHVRVAWHALDALPLLQALPRFCAALQAVVRAHGAQDKFHATMSVAFLLLIHERMQDGESWSTFEAREEAFIAAGLQPVRALYSERQLQRTSAREHFELPETQLSRDL